jgi:hypothetical protein
VGAMLPESVSRTRLSMYSPTPLREIVIAAKAAPTKSRYHGELFATRSDVPAEERIEIQDRSYGNAENYQTYISRGF